MLPELAHWFGIHGADLADIPEDELAEFRERLKHLPPIGGRGEYVWERWQE